MEALEASMKKHNIHLDTSSTSSSRHGLSVSSYIFNASSSSNEHLMFFGASYHMTIDKSIFSALNGCNTKQFFVGNDIYVSVVGS